MTLTIHNEDWAHRLAYKGRRKAPSGRGTLGAALKIITLIGHI